MIGLVIADVPVIRPAVLENGEARFAKQHAKWIENHYGPERVGDFCFEEDWKWIDVAHLHHVFTLDELIWQWIRTFVSSRFDRHHYEDDDLIWKVRNSLWHYGRISTDTAALHRHYVALMAGLRRLRVDLPDFEIRLTHSTTMLTAGMAKHMVDDPQRRFIWLDASFGVLLFYKGEYVMTIGFGLSELGVFIAQVQLREKRGNRFLYRLPSHHLDFAIDLLARAFREYDVWLVTGESAVEGVQRSYRKNIAKFDATAVPRILELYDLPLAHYTRTGETYHTGGSDLGHRQFVKLAANGAP